MHLHVIGAPRFTVYYYDTVLLYAGYYCKSTSVHQIREDRNSVIGHLPHCYINSDQT